MAEPAAIALIAGFSTWIMVIFKPDGSHGMYSWIHVLLATARAVRGLVFAVLGARGQRRPVQKPRPAPGQ